MGTWGFGIFQNDDALDFLHEVLEQESAMHAFVEIVQSTGDEGIIDADDCVAISVYGALIESLVNGTTIEFENAELKNWLEINQGIAIDDQFKDFTIQAMQLVISERSELRELWEEDEQDFESWKSTIVAIIRRLEIR